MINRAKRRQSGFTIVELMIVIVVAAILLTAAVPNLQEIFKRNEIAGQNNDLIALIHLARNEAIRRNLVGGNRVTVEFVRNLEGATWEAFVWLPDDDETAEGCPIGAIRCSTHSKARLLSDDWANDNLVISFDNRGYSVDSNGAPVAVEMFVIHRDCDNDRHARRVRVMPAGQVSSNESSCG